MENIELNQPRFLDLLKKLISESKHVQNLPPQLVPQEDLVINHLLPLLKPHSVENGGPLVIKHIAFVEGRGNLILEYASDASVTKTVGFVGSHLDVVPADPKNWTVDPFQLTIKGDQLFGRGTTDCLGHVALITDLFLQLAEKKPKLNVKVIAVFIASEENSSIPGIGVDELVKHGHLKELSNGPVYWVDSADSQPCIGTGGVVTWSLKTKGKLGHSGFPHRSINAIELGYHAINHIQQRFRIDFPAHQNEAVYSFGSSSSLKTTKLVGSEGSLNQIPGFAELQGDIRLTPFYQFSDVQSKIQSYVAEINANIDKLEGHGPQSPFLIVDENGVVTKGEVSFEFQGPPSAGIACNLESPGFKALSTATQEVIGHSKPYSVCGSLPLVADLQAEGFDLQVAGFGISKVYHGDDEYCNLSDMVNASKILAKVIASLSSSA